MTYLRRFMTRPLFKGGLRKDAADLKRRFNLAIMAAKTDGTIKRLSENWFGYGVTP